MRLKYQHHNNNLVHQVFRFKKTNIVEKQMISKNEKNIIRIEHVKQPTKPKFSLFVNVKIVYKPLKYFEFQGIKKKMRKYC